MLCLLLVVGLNQIIWWLVVGLIAGWADAFAIGI
jgi:hypothetical protein